MNAGERVIVAGGSAAILFAVFTLLVLFYPGVGGLSTLGQTEDIEIISYIPTSEGNCYLYTSDDRVFWVAMPDSLKVASLAGQFPVSCEVEYQLSFGNYPSVALLNFTPPRGNTNGGEAQ